MSVKLHVGNISFNTTNQDLRDLFGNIGSISTCEIVADRATGRSRGFAFVEMASKAESENAIAQLNELKIDGREISVSLAKSKHLRSSGCPNVGGDYQSDNYTGYTARAYMN